MRPHVYSRVSSLPSPGTATSVPHGQVLITNNTSFFTPTALLSMIMMLEVPTLIPKPTTILTVILTLSPTH